MLVLNKLRKYVFHYKITTYKQYGYVDRDMYQIVYAINKNIEFYQIDRPERSNPNTHCEVLFYVKHKLVSTKTDLSDIVIEFMLVFRNKKRYKLQMGDIYYSFSLDVRIEKYKS